MKNVMLIVPNLHTGGQERMTVVMAEALKEDYEVTIVLFDSSKISFDVSGHRIININIPTKKGIFHKVINVLRRVKALKKLKKTEKTDIAYSLGMTANLANVLSKGNEICCGSIRGYDTLEDKIMLKLVSKKADILTACSIELAEETEKIVKKKIDIIPNAYDIENIKRLAEEKKNQNLFEGKKTIVSVGRIADAKGYWHLIKAIAIAKKEVKNLQVIIVGGKGDIQPYRQLAKDLGIEEAVIFAGNQNNPFSFVSQADAYVLSSISEGFPNALVEAMTCRKAVIATNCQTGPAEILTDNYKKYRTITEILYGRYGILVPVASSQKNWDASYIEREERILAKAIVELLTKRELREQYEVLSEERAAEFSLDRLRSEFKYFLKYEK